jgi:prolyl-tRNA editing enzyme YbaK/EbsC (Cys-tRNA(Pro) deacylase)
MLPAAEIVDPRVLEQDRVTCSGGDHEHGVVLDPRELVRATDAQVADVCEQP